ncbi:hypothetical protein SETIT_5G307300v2 [Setaria italica]|uniref:Uncharacterized protein n=1 Tax=Setaria italica TaxID=4555 RepID=A0A368RC96_SETIT|nr:uncharacterized protein LOC101761656 isoform X1 [Setaria italica]RCV27220.1 hypothetical protein SETIT_5G307300v2 [Setaria italica]
MPDRALYGDRSAADRPAAHNLVFPQPDGSNCHCFTIRGSQLVSRARLCLPTPPGTKGAARCKIRQSSGTGVNSALHPSGSQPYRHRLPPPPPPPPQLRLLRLLHRHLPICGSSATSIPRRPQPHSRQALLSLPNTGSFMDGVQGSKNDYDSTQDKQGATVSGLDSYKDVGFNGVLEPDICGPSSELRNDIHQEISFWRRPEEVAAEEDGGQAGGGCGGG